MSKTNYQANDKDFLKLEILLDEWLYKMLGWVQKDQAPCISHDRMKYMQRRAELFAALLPDLIFWQIEHQIQDNDDKNL